ncbi:MAG: LysM peptidoglycan-binding domain-containing protein [Galactobacter sp.]
MRSPAPEALSPTAAWAQLVTLCATTALCGWGLWWSAVCLLAGIARIRLAVTGTTPAWTKRLPSRCLIATGLAATATFSVLAPANAATPSATMAAVTTAGPEFHSADPGWPIANEPSGSESPSTTSPGAEEVASPHASNTAPPASSTFQPSKNTGSAQDQRQATSAPRTWNAPRPSTDLPSTLGASRRDEVIVAHGDTLWDLAAKHLGPSANTHDIAQEWPRWYRANRDVIGNDPHLILPGTRLLPP